MDLNTNIKSYVSKVDYEKFNIETDYNNKLKLEDKTNKSEFNACIDRINGRFDKIDDNARSFKDQIVNINNQVGNRLKKIESDIHSKAKISDLVLIKNELNT